MRDPSMKQVFEKDLLIQEKEKLYTELHKILVCQPSLELKEQVSKCERKFFSKMQKLTHVKSKLLYYKVCFCITKNRKHIFTFQ